MRIERKTVKKYDRKLIKTTRFLNANANVLESTCFFCDGVDVNKSNLHNGTLQMASTMGRHCHIQTTATELYDEKWLAELSQNMLQSKGKTIFSI